jgi:hypothetical protein
MYSGLIQRRQRGLVRARAVSPCAGRPSDGVIYRVAGNGGDEQQHARKSDVERAGGRKGAGGEEQGVAGQNRRHHQAGFGKDDREEHRIHPAAVGADEIE